MVTSIFSFIKSLLKRKAKKDHAAIPENVKIQRKDHCISKVNISENALKVLNRLVSSHHQAYLVGGSVRDLLLKKTPKDFDVVTSAHPQQVRKLFKNSRIIGRRFKLVHVLFYRDMIEVATFRKEEDQNVVASSANAHGIVTNDNCYGTLEEDVWRRDLTINALYYDHNDSCIIDYVGGTQDIKNKIIRMIGNPSKRYEEDPVRMLRVIRFAAKLDFAIEEQTLAAIKEKNKQLALASSSRLFDEMVKLYHCGNALKAHSLLCEHHLFPHVFPQTAELIKHCNKTNTLIQHTLENTDSRIKAKKPVTPAFFFASLLWFPLMRETEQLRKEGLPFLPALEKAMNIVLANQHKYIKIPKRFSQIIREIWLLQYKLPRRFGIRAFKTLEHPRFRAAYDFLLLRALAEDEDPALAEWWTTFQEVDEQERKQMIRRLKKR